MALPYPILLFAFPGLSKRTRFLLAVAGLILLVAVGVTGSRGAVVGLVAVILTLIALSRKPVRNALIVGTGALMTLTMLLRVLPSAYVERVESMSDPDNSTRVERLYSWSIGWQMYLANPVLGVGAGNYPWTNHLYASRSPMFDPHKKLLGGREAHSLYFTLISELGTVGALIYVAIIRLIYVRYRSMRDYCKTQRAPSEDALKFELLFKAFLASCIGFLASGAFITVLYYAPFWHLIGMVAAAHRVARLNFGLDRPKPMLTGHSRRAESG